MSAGYPIADQHAYGRVPPGHLRCTCWCEHDYVIVTERDVVNGRTKSCGAKDCRPREEANA